MIICYCGASTGSGKTHLMLEHGIRRANRYQKAIVTNFPLDLDGLYRYALLNNYYHILKLINCGGIFYVDAECNIEMITKVKRAVILADELGFLAFSRDHSSTPRELLKDVALSRHDGSDLFFSCQYAAQVDVGFTRLCHWFFFCKSFNIDDKDGNPQMQMVSYYKFNKAKFEMWIASPKAQDNPLKTRFAYAMETVDRLVSINDKWIFSTYDSFGKLGGKLEFTCGKYLRLKNIPSIDAINNWEVWRDYFWNNGSDFICGDKDFSEKEIYISISQYRRKIKLSFSMIFLRLFRNFPAVLQDNIIKIANYLEYGVNYVPKNFVERAFNYGYFFPDFFNTKKPRSSNYRGDIRKYKEENDRDLSTCLSKQSKLIKHNQCHSVSSPGQDSLSAIPLKKIRSWGNRKTN